MPETTTTLTPLGGFRQIAHRRRIRTSDTVMSGRPYPSPAFFISVLLSALPFAARTQDLPPAGWGRTWNFLVEDVCVDDRGHVIASTSPLDGQSACPHKRKLGIGEKLPYHKRDWPSVADKLANPSGYQQSDSFPIRTTYGPTIVQTYDFGNNPRAFGQFDQGDGGQIAFFSSNTASMGITEDGGAGLQFFLGPSCTPEDGWVVVDRTFETQDAGQMLARITRSADQCRRHLGYAFTRWHVQPITYRTQTRGRLGHTTLETLVSEHFGGQTVEDADHLERMYFTHALGYTRWERWQNNHPGERQQAEVSAMSGRCEPELGPPLPTGSWIMIDCREWTQILPPSDVAGDLADFWIDRLSRDEATHAILTP